MADAACMEGPDYTQESRKPGFPILPRRSTVRNTVDELHQQVALCEQTVTGWHTLNTFQSSVSCVFAFKRHLACPANGAAAHCGLDHQREAVTFKQQNDALVRSGKYVTARSQAGFYPLLQSAGYGRV